MHYYVEFQWNSPLSYEGRLVQAPIFSDVIYTNVHIVCLLTSSLLFVRYSFWPRRSKLTRECVFHATRVAYITRQQSLSHVALCLGLRYVTLVITLYTQPKFMRETVKNYVRHLNYH